MAEPLAPSTIPTPSSDADLLAIIGSWRDTLADAEVLALLQEYNMTAKAPLYAALRAGHRGASDPVRRVNAG
jgi:hypothetical protein